MTLSSCEAELVALQSGVQKESACSGLWVLCLVVCIHGLTLSPQDAQVTWYDEAESDDEDSMKVSYLFPLVVKTDSLSGENASRSI